MNQDIMDAIKEMIMYLSIISTHMVGIHMRLV
jgi:hypothetical protein